jgi:hypothetical protein
VVAADSASLTAIVPADLPSGAAVLFVAVNGALSNTITYTVGGGAAVTPTPTPTPGVLFSDSFRRADAEPCSLDQVDNALGGSGAHYYLPIFPSAQGPIGAKIRSNWLENNGLDFGGVQFAALPGSCNSLIRGEDLGQDFNITVELVVPGTSGRITQAGPYFRSRAAAAGDGTIGGEAAGYWVQLWSTGEVKVKRLSPQVFVASSAAPANFDSNAVHTLQVAVQGSGLQVALDGTLLSLDQGGQMVATVSIPATAGSNAGTAGIAFGAETNRGQAGGQKARNLVVSAYGSLR